MKECCPHKIHPSELRTVFVVMAEEDHSFIAVCETEKAAEDRAWKYFDKYGDTCEVFEEELEKEAGSH